MGVQFSRDGEGIGRRAIFPGGIFRVRGAVFPGRGGGSFPGWAVFLDSFYPVRPWRC